MLYYTKNVFTELNVSTFDRLFYYYVLLLLYKHKKYILTIVNHNYNTRYRCNVNIVSGSNTSFGSQCTSKMFKYL